jgi:hypothetical protein
MPSQRILGEDVSILIVSGGVVQNTITDVRSFEMTAQTEILRESYLGETTDRRDEVYRGVAGRLEFHVENSDFLALQRAIVDRARRKSPALKINIKATASFPNGDRPQIIVPDAKFGEMPIGVGGRTEYVTFGLTFEAEEYQVIG